MSKANNDSFANFSKINNSFSMDNSALRIDISKLHYFQYQTDDIINKMASRKLNSIKGGYNEGSN